MAIQSLTHDELLGVLKVARAKRERDWLMILLAYQHGLRASEVVALTPDNFHEGTITVKRLKGSEETTHRLRGNVEPLLDEQKGVFDFLLNLHGNQRLFSITRERFWQLFQEYGAAADLPKHKRHPHALKHTRGRQAIKTTGIENVRKFLGHKSIASTGQYLQVTDEEADAAVGDSF